MYDRNCIRSYYYYETLRLTAVTHGDYVFSTGKSSDVHMRLYENHFDPLNPGQNLVPMEPYGCFNVEREGRYAVQLRSDTMYVLLVTTSLPKQITPFSIDVYGPSNVTLQHFGK